MEFKILNSAVKKAALFLNVDASDYLATLPACDCFECQDTFAIDAIDKMFQAAKGKLPDDYSAFFTRINKEIAKASTVAVDTETAPLYDGSNSFAKKLAATTPPVKKVKAKNQAISADNWTPAPLWSWKYAPTTQKARGITFLGANYHHTYFQVNTHNFFPADMGLPSFMQLKYPLFVRPCPKTPRHGFVDSRIVNSNEALRIVIEETFAADKEAEIGICKPLTAKHSAVYANGTLAVGTGHDGATSGKDSVTFLTINSEDPVLSVDIPEIIVAKDEETYYEFVYTSDGAFVVQARSGPKVTTGVKDLIFNEGGIEQVLVPTGNEDLLEWEKTIQNLAGKPGVVVFTKDLGNHFAVHCIVNKVNVITSHTPVVGEVLVKTNDLPPLNAEDFRRGFDFGAMVGKVYGVNTSNVLVSLSDWLAYVLHVLHNAAIYITAGEAFRIGVACGVFVNIVAVLGVGEMRHKSSAAAINFSGSRYDVYTASSTYNDAVNLRNLLLSNYGGFAGVQWGGSYGGPKWADVQKGGIDVFNSIFESPAKAIAELNIAVNKEHNGGWFMNKFAQHSLMDDAVANPSRFSITHGSALFSLMNAIGKIKEAPVSTGPITEDDLKKAKETAKAGTTAAAPKTSISAPEKKPVVVSFKSVKAQVRNTESKLRFQFKGEGISNYVEVDVSMDNNNVKNFAALLKNEEANNMSMAATKVKYVELAIDDNGNMSTNDLVYPLTLQEVVKASGALSNVTFQ